MDIRFCKDCVYYNPTYARDAECKHPLAIDMVSGEKQRTCYDMRLSEFYPTCRPDAILFKPRDIQ